MFYREFAVYFSCHPEFISESDQWAGSSYCGAIGSKMFGVTGSMLGTGIGNLANNKLNNMLFD